MELLERLQGGLRAAREKGWTLKFVTLTWAEDVNKERVRLDLQHLVQTIRRRYGYCEYVKVAELTRNGRIHLHLAMVMPFIPQKVLSAMWRAHADAPIVWIRAIRDIPGIRRELAKYMTKAPVGKVSYSRGFPKAELVQVKAGPCDACDGQEHTFMHITVSEAEENFRFEVLGREMPGLAIRPTGGIAKDCGCWPADTPETG